MISDADGRLQVVFRRLDPLLQTLLPLVARFQEVVDSSENQSSSSLRELILSQTQVLQNTADVLIQFGPSELPSLVVLADYISLPLNAVLHVSATFSRTFKAENKPQDRIFASHIRRLNQSAAHTIQIFVQALCSSTTPGSLPSTRLKDTHIINFVVAIASVLPASTTLHVDGKALDDGLELCMTLLGAIKTLIHVCSGTSLYDKWEGDLVVKIVDFGTSIDVLDNDHLHLLSIEVLDGLLTKVKRSDLWQRIFPGIFTHLYRRLIASGRKTSAGLSMQIEAKSLKAIEELIKVSMSPFVRHSSMNSETSILRNSMLYAHSTKKTGQSNEEPKFLLDVKKRVSEPLGNLIRQCSLSSSESVQLQVISLCKTILVESRACWRSTSLPENALDVCLTLQTQDSRETLETPLKSIIATFQDSKLGKESWMIPRIRSLAGGTLSMAKDGSKQTEIRMELQLLMGYIRYLGTNGSASLATSTGIRASFVELGDVDLESCSPHNVKKVTNGEESTTNLLFQHLSKDTGALFRKVLRQYGSTIGWKHGSRLIDILLSEFCERSFEHLKSSSGNFQLEFFHKNIGALVVCEEVIRGAYASGQTVNRKEYKRKRSSLRALASSCLPLFLDASLWNICTIEGSMEASHPRAFQANACVIALILKVVAAFFDVMGRDSGMLTQMMLCPIIEKASQRNNAVVRATAQEAGLALAMALEFSTLSDIVQQNLSSVLVGLLARLRSLPWNTTPSEILLLDGMKAVQWVLLQSNASEEGIRSFADFLSFIETQLDQLTVFNPLSTFTMQDMVALHQAYLAHTGDFFSGNDSELAHVSATLRPKSGAWMDVLSPYEKCSSPSIPESTLVSEGLPLPHDSEIYIVGFRIISRIISRDNNILCKSNLGLQVSACRVMASAYRALARFPQKTKDTQVENAILKQTAKSWPSIKARIHSISEDVLQARVVKISSIAYQTSPSPKVELATSQYFLAELLELTAVLCECCGDFMTTRFTKDVWPKIARYLGSIVQSKSHLRVLSPEAVSLNVDTTRWETEVCSPGDSEQQLVISTLGCLGRVYGVLDLPEDVLSAAALVLLPFLDTCHFGANIGESAMLALKQLAHSNCDVLWRPLLQLLGTSLPPFPKYLAELADETSVGVRLHSDQNVLPQKAAELLSYIKCLPEQPIY